MRAGSAVVEYVAILAAVSVIAAILCTLGGTAVEVFSLARLPLIDQRLVGEATNVSDHHSQRTLRTNESGVSATVVSSLGSRAIPLALAVLVSLLALSLLRHRRRIERLGWVADEEVVSTREVPQQRLFDKRQKLLRFLANQPELLLENRMQVRHVMTRDVVSVTPDTGFEEMVTLMKGRHMRHLVVCSKEGHVLGMVSDRDLCRPQGTKAKHFMSTRLLTASPDSPLGSAVTQLINEQVSCLPVLEGDTLCGIVSTSDIALALQCFMQLWGSMTQVVDEPVA